MMAVRALRNYSDSQCTLVRLYSHIIVVSS